MAVFTKVEATKDGVKLTWTLETGCVYGVYRSTENITAEPSGNSVVNGDNGWTKLAQVCVGYYVDTTAISNREYAYAVVYSTTQSNEVKAFQASAPYNLTQGLVLSEDEVYVAAQNTSDAKTYKAALATSNSNETWELRLIKYTKTAAGTESVDDNSAISIAKSTIKNVSGYIPVVSGTFRLDYIK